mmetsp:Transcript_530/g.922  ORF Transcript_530/g.922 Transcript_530/m.922 type:complete len:630 (-) Transcript_530:1187-3076(-)|eukprot:CAMPEP_0176493564 /NCGR_PEP_ID=MMETSP0200_2-20121128/9615_1 /TAXON_ID=947934 /ORGANISM="Chaetoceros sp., Strain GSL56" /LENGTH=629 /DNA_ID=CAMNT_0017891233 /DNA_START=240 /DNA_END=2129 /DNA_ORIENTATION=-
MGSQQNQITVDAVTDATNVMGGSINNTAATPSRNTGDSLHGNGSPDTNNDHPANYISQYSNIGSTAATNDRTTDVMISLDELKYGFSSFHAICTPVSITMILAALAVTYIQLESSSNTDEVSSFYTIFDVSNTSNSDAKNFGLSLVNGLVIISVIATATFVIVLLYKYRCMKLLLGYMIFSSTALLGLLGGVMFRTFIERYNVVMDQITFYFLLVNFAAVGTISIFFAKGIPTYITQMYLVLTSCILAWQLSFFNDWTAWVLLVLLALYDLCAVLTPCGPLKALVRLMQKDDAPEMPGLLYEARLPEGVDRPSTSTRRRTGRNSTGRDSWNDASERGDGGGGAVAAGRNSNGNTSAMDDTAPILGQDRSFVNGNQNHSDSNEWDGGVQQSAAVTESGGGDVEGEGGENNIAMPGVLPFAIAKIYKLPIQREGCPQFVIDKYRPRSDPPVRSEYTSAELLTEVNVLYPRNGGKIVIQEPDSDASAPRWRRSDGTHLPRYVIFDRHGVLKRVLVMNEDGKVFEEVRGDRSERRSSEGGASNMSNTIKLGLGDFIFYSVLVAKAALNSFTTFAACMLVILAGLGGTLVLLSVYHSALPALPISIFLGVIFYFTTKVLIEPWIETILSVPFYV